MGACRIFNIIETGVPDGQPALFVHGFGCDQSMWRLMKVHFERDYRVLTFDLMGLGKSDVSHYDPKRYSNLAGYADDIIEICEQLELADVLLVGHSAGATIAALAVGEQPLVFDALALLVPSACYIDDGEYCGGFSRSDIEDLLESLDGNYLGWAAAMAPAIMGRPDRPELGEELTELFCRADPAVASRFARATFLGDNRDDLANIDRPTLVVACQNDVIAPRSATEFVHRSIADSEYVELPVSGHCPNLSAPNQTAAAVLDFHRALRRQTRV